MQFSATDLPLSDTDKTDKTPCSGEGMRLGILPPGVWSEPLVSARPAACFENYIQGAFSADQFPAQVAAAWIGNSMSVAMKHYRQVTEDHFKQAAQGLTRKTCRRCAGDVTAVS